MAKNIFYLIVVVCLASCNKDILNQVPKETLSENIVFSDPAAAEQFLNIIYTKIESGFERTESNWGSGCYMLDALSDDGDVTFTWSESQSFNLGSFSPSATPLTSQWANLYYLVRSANLAISKMDGVAGDAEVKNRLKGEAYFLRAYLHHELLRFYGSKKVAGKNGIPIIDKPLTVEDNLQIPRSTYDETVSFIVEDLNKAATLLPNRDKTVAGRATKGAALALKSRVLLYGERWVEAAAAAKEVMNLSPGYSLFSNYGALFITKNNSEIIFAKKFLNPIKVHGSAIFAGNGGEGFNPGFSTVNSPAYGSFGGWGGTCPTQDFVDAYPMTDGKTITESPLYNANDPYVGRDPRFRETVFYNGSTFAGKTVETFEGGSNSKAAGTDATNTGYYLRKFHDPAITVLYPNSSDQDWIYIRYAEVLLNYAEAQNEAVGPDATVYDAIKQLRDRAGISPLVAGLSKEDMRTRIRNERRVELAFEEHRFFDIRRWGIAKQVLNGPIRGMRITKTGPTFTYTPFVFETRTFTDKMYVMPIPQFEVDRNPSAGQIGGW